MTIKITKTYICDHCNQEIKDMVYIDASVYGKIAHVSCLLVSMTPFLALKFLGLDEITVQSTKEGDDKVEDLICMNPTALKALVD